MISMTNRTTSRASLLLPVLALAGCVQPYNGPPIARYVPPTLPHYPTTMATQDQTAGIEQQDRINRFSRLAMMQGIPAPEVQQIVLPPGSVDFMAGAVPVVRVVFPERAFFAFNDDTPLPQAAAILDVIANNMRHDVPDAALTVLGHTDSIGSDAYNLDLSRRRAEAVMRALVGRGVKPDQLSEVAIGKRQPIAPNSTPDGRALNRRVEFLISPAMGANLAAVRQRVIPDSYFATGEPDDTTTPPPPADSATVYKLSPTERAAPGDTETLALAPQGDLNLNPPSPDPSPFIPASAPVTSSAAPAPGPAANSAALVVPAPVTPTAPAPRLLLPTTVSPRPLSSSGIDYQ